MIRLGRGAGEGVQVSERVFTPLAIEFIQFCFSRRAVGWPQLYDEMCYVASNKLFQGLGYEELRESGIDFTLSGLQRTARLAVEVTRRMRAMAAAT